MWTTIQLAFAGIGHLLWHWGIGVGTILLILAIEFFSAQIIATVPILERPLNAIRKDLLWVAVGIAVFLGGEYLGAKDMAGRCDAKAAVISEKVSKSVSDAINNPGSDPWDTNQ